MSTRSAILALAVVGLLLRGASPAVAAPEGEMTWAVHVSLAPTWFDPAETPSVITPFMILYALHDALVKPMPGNPMAPSLAESWSVSHGRPGLRLRAAQGREVPQRRPRHRRRREVLARALPRRRGHDAEGAGGRRRRRRSRARAHPAQAAVAGLHDLLRHAGDGRGLDRAQAYVEQVGEDGFKKAPIGAGPYRFVSFTPGIELVLEANESYWRKTPSVKRLVFRSVPDETTRLAMLKRGEADIAYSIRGPLAEELRRTPGLTLKPTSPTFTEWLTSPSSGIRSRRGPTGACAWPPTSPSTARPSTTPSTSATPSDAPASFPTPSSSTGRRRRIRYDPARAKQLLAEAGYPRGFDAGEITTDAVYAATAEAVINYFLAVGIRASCGRWSARPSTRATGEELQEAVRPGSAASGNAATRIEAFVVTGGIRSYGGYPDIDGLFREQAVEPDRKKREALLHRIQQLMHERVMFAADRRAGVPQRLGPRVEESGFGSSPAISFSSPYEDIKLKSARP